MSFTQEDLCSCATTRDLIRNHGGPGSVFRVAVEQNGRHLAGVGGRLHGPVVHGGVNDALHPALQHHPDRKSTRLNSSHANISYAVFCLKKKNRQPVSTPPRALSPDS